MGLLFAIWSYCIIVDFRLDAKRTNSVLRGPFSRINCFETNVGHLQPTRVSCVRKKTQKNIESFSFKFDNVRLKLKSTEDLIETTICIFQFLSD